MGDCSAGPRIGKSFLTLPAIASFLTSFLAARVLLRREMLPLSPEVSASTFGGAMKRSLACATLMYVAVVVLTLNAQQTTGAKPMDGQSIFRYDTFGDEQLWTDVLRLQEVLPSVTPLTALTVAGLKVDADALPPPVVAALQAGQLDVNDPKVTLRLLELNAVVGVIGKVAGDELKSVGITCALCHSTVDNSLAPGIGKRLDGWP